MNRLSFLKALGIGGAALTVGSTINFDESITPEVQEKIVELKNALLLYDNYESEFGYVFSPKGMYENMRIDVHRLMSSKKKWWYENWSHNDFLNKKDNVTLWSSHTDLYCLLNEVNSIREECINIRKNYKWQSWMFDGLTQTIARTNLLLKNFDGAKVWYGKLGATKNTWSYNEWENDYNSDYDSFNLPTPNDIVPIVDDIKPETHSYFTNISLKRTEIKKTI